MAIERQRVLSIAVASRKIAYVFFIDGCLKDWHLSRAGGMSAPKGRSFLRTAIAQYKPDLVVIESPYGPTRKYGKPHEILLAMAQDLADSATPHRIVIRTQAYANKYDEAAALAGQFPEISPWLPKIRRLWDNEPTETIYFEALALAQELFGEELGGTERGIRKSNE